MNLDFPTPPEHLAAGLGQFEPAPDVARWVRHTFINDDARLFNPEHEHLQQAEIGFLWTNEPLERRQRMIIGTCQAMPPSGDAWSVGRFNQQLFEWFPDRELDFLITLYAPWCADADAASFMALVEHELCHAAQKVGKDGPMFNKETGRPVFTTRGHDVEQFVSVVRRYGAGPAGVQALVDAAIAGPEIAPAEIAAACGICLRVGA